jgi:RNA-directed DNA polymerase
MENLLEAWKEFARGKRSKRDVQEFEQRLMTNIISLHNDLISKRYAHSEYHAFSISDPKRRDIHKAQVRDRLLHHALYRVLYPFFDRVFTSHAYSCRKEKGTHKAMLMFGRFFRTVSRNDTQTVWVLKCDVRKFFASIDHAVLRKILARYVSDQDILELFDRVIGSFCSTREGVGLPLGNLTSQLLVNVYMNEFDQYVKHRLRAKHYIRYADDFVLMHEDREVLEEWLVQIGYFLRDNLKLDLHPNKVSIKTFSSGVDFLGWVHFSDYKVLRTATKKRMLKRLEKNPVDSSVQSYKGMLKHGNARKLEMAVDLLASKADPESEIFF